MPFHYEKLAVKADAHKVFDDPRRLRFRRVRAIVALSMLCLMAWLYLFLNGTFSWQTAWDEITGNWSEQQALALPATDPVTQTDDIRLASLMPVLPPKPFCEAPSQPFFAAMAGPAAPVVYGHIPSDNDWGQLSLTESCNQLGVLVPDWLRIEATASGAKVLMETEESRAPVMEYRSKSGNAPDLMPKIELDTGEDKAAFISAISSKAVAQRTTAQVIEHLRPLYPQGACLSIPGLETSDLPALQPFFQTLSSGLKAEGMASCIVLSGTSSAWKSKETTALFDKVILKLFLDPWVGTAPSPLATDVWFEETAKSAAEQISKDKLVVALGNFAVEWTSGKPLPDVLPYAAAMERIADAGTKVRFSAKTSGSLASYRDAEGRSRKIWMQDAASLINQMGDFARSWHHQQRDLVAGPRRSRHLDRAAQSQPQHADTERRTGTGKARQLRQLFWRGSAVATDPPSVPRHPSIEL